MDKVEVIENGSPVPPKKRRGTKSRVFSFEEIKQVMTYWEMGISKKDISILCQLSPHFVNRILKENPISKPQADEKLEEDVSEDNIEIADDIYMEL